MFEVEFWGLKTLKSKLNDRTNESVEFETWLGN